MIKKLLIANRGEIACRVIKTARKYSSDPSSITQLKLLGWASKLSQFTVTLIKTPDTLRWPTRLTTSVLLLQVNRSRSGICVI